MFQRTGLMTATIAATTLGGQLAAQAQCSEYGWKAFDGVPGVYAPFSTVYAARPWDPDGAGPKPALLVVGGGFQVAGRVASSGIATWDGATWRSLGGGFQGTVFALAVFRGELIAAGHFSSAGEVLVSNIARWNGTAWVPLGAGTNERVRALHVHNGELIAGGDFTAAGQSLCNRIARWDGVDWRSVGPASTAALRRWPCIRAR